MGISTTAPFTRHRHLLAALATAGLLLSTVAAHAEPWRAWVVARHGEGDYTTAAVQARVGEAVELSVVVQSPTGDWLADIESFRVGRRQHGPDGPLPEGAQVRWLEVAPRLWHTNTTPPNPGNATFSNNVLFGPDHGEWLGYDTLEYETRVLAVWDHQARHGHDLTIEAAHRTWSQGDMAGSGSNWYAVEVVLPDGTTVRAADGTSIDRYGLTTDVMRLSFRADDSYLGWLGTYFNVPNLFGSTGPSNARHQSERYVGADCADVLVAAFRASGHDEADYTSVAGIGDLTHSVTDVLVLQDDGRVTRADGSLAELQWGVDVLPGDLLALNYEDDSDSSLPRAWDHIGALAADSGPLGSPDGILSGVDLWRHISGEGLLEERLMEQGHIRFRVWRWDD